MTVPLYTSFTLLYFKDDPPSQNMESFIQDPAPDEVIAEIQPVTFQIVESGTKRRKSSLIDSLGFSYNVHSRRPYATYWQCTVRPKGNPCKASVTERDGVFRPGQQSHNHIVEVGAATAAKIVSKVKSKALEEKFKPASAIVDEVTIRSIFLFQKEKTCTVFLSSYRNASERLSRQVSVSTALRRIDYELGVYVA